MLRLSPIIGHRGARAHAPENTLAGLRRAAELGARWVEFDVMLTRDGVPILIHDDTLDRTTSGSGAVADHSLDQIRRLDAGSWFAPEFAGEPVPTLAEALALVFALDLDINLEIKPAPGHAVTTAQGALTQARHLWPAGRRPPLISSFEPVCLEVAHRTTPDWPRGYLMDEPPNDWAAIADRLDAWSLHVDASRQTPETVAAYRATGRPVLAYTVNDPTRAHTLFTWGVAAIFTDDPTLLKECRSRTAGPGGGMGAAPP